MALHQKGCWAVVSGTEAKSSTREAEKSWDTKAEEGLMIIGLTVEPSQYSEQQKWCRSMDSPKEYLREKQQLHLNFP